MKKLMFAALGAAVTSGAFAAPVVYDYKASVKHMYAKIIRVEDYNGRVQEVYSKYIQSAKLKGYLVVDGDAATSLTHVNDRNASGSTIDTLDGVDDPIANIDHGRNRAFLVVQNTSAKVPAGVNAREFRTSRILPANLEVSFINPLTPYDEATGRPEARSGLAQGYLYVGGEFVAPVRPKMDVLIANTLNNPVDATPRSDAPSTVAPVIAPAAATVGMAMIQDYAWQSYALFGQFNSADFNGRLAVYNPGWWQASQLAIDIGFEVPVQMQTIVPGWTGEYFFHDTWMNGSGFGKFIRDTKAGSCCGFAGTATTAMLSTLSGNLKGGLFLCTYQGLVHVYGQQGRNAWFNDVQDWEDQWFTPLTQALISAAFAGDQDQRDLWQDGGLELNTTDVITGTWSIKLRSKNVPVAAPTVAELNVLTGRAPAVPNAWTEDSTGLMELVSTLKGCALQLNNQTLFVATSGATETPARVAQPATRWSVPALSPAFAKYYGLANFR